MSCSMAAGWSPLGSNVDDSLNGEATDMAERTAEDRSLLLLRIASRSGLEAGRPGHSCQEVVRNTGCIWPPSGPREVPRPHPSMLESTSLLRFRQFDACSDCESGARRCQGVSARAG